MNEMYVMNATDVRREWSSVVEKAIRERPQFIKRTRDQLVLTDIKLMEGLLSAYTFTATKLTEVDGSITLSLNEIDLIENAPTETKAKYLLGKSILEYADEYYNEFTLWSSAPNRKTHIPYILKAILIDDAGKIGDSIECQAGEI